jgi:hypothetical protein
VHPFQHLRRKVVEALEQFGRAGIGGAGFAFLLIGQGQSAQRQDFVDLGGIEQVASALRCDSRVVIQDDR